MSDEQKISTNEPANYDEWKRQKDLSALKFKKEFEAQPGWDTWGSTANTAANSLANSPTSMPKRRLFPKSVKAVTSDYIPLTNSIMPQGRSILATGGGLSNNPVQYTNSRSFKNAYKGAGSLSSSKLLHGMKTGDGLEKGHSILNSGGGLKGMSLFKMKHYDPLPVVVEEAISGEKVYDAKIVIKPVSDAQQKKNQAKAKSQAAAFESDVTDHDDDDNDDNTVFDDDSSDDDQTDSSKSTNIKGDKGAKSSKSTNIKGDKGTKSSKATNVKGDKGGDSDEGDVLLRI